MGAGAALEPVETGGALPFATRAYPNHNYVFPITLAPHEERQIFMRFTSTDGLLIPAKLWEPAAFHIYERNNYLRQALYFGTALAMITFNLLLFFSIREGIYLLYVVLTVFVSLTIAAANGIAHEWVWPGASTWSNMSHFVGYAVSMAVLLMFMLRMLNVRRLMPRLSRVVIGIAACFALMPIAFYFALEKVSQTAALLNLAAAFMVVGIGIVFCLKRQRAAYIFLLAFSLAIVGAVITVLRGQGVLETNFFNTCALQMGSAMEMMLLALALADRFNNMRREKEMAQGQTMLAQSQSLKAEQQVVETLRTSERLLEARVLERTVELSNSLEQLKHTQAELVQSEKMASLGVLVAGVAHELNTPIGNALTTASALQDSTQEFQNVLARGELKKSMLNAFVQGAMPMTNMIFSSCERAANLIRSFKQVAVDQASEQRRTFSLHSLVEDNIAALRPSMRNAPVHIVVNIAQDIACDSYPGPLGQVIVNLVQNAVVHAFAGRESGLLTISAHVQGNQVAMQFEDDGVGMEHAVLVRIFEPFYTTRLGQGGSGLGLSISLNIVTGLLGGTLTAESVPGRGSRLDVQFPVIAPKRGTARVGQTGAEGDIGVLSQ